MNTQVRIHLLVPAPRPSTVKIPGIPCGLFAGCCRLLALITVYIAFVPALALAQSPPTIGRLSGSTSRSLGDRMNFQVSVISETTFTHQWRFNGAELPGATNASLTLTNLTIAHAGAYSVLVANAAGSVISDPITLDIDTAFTVMADSPIAQDSGQGVSWVDYDGDGWVDLYSAGETRHLLYHNNRDGTFSRPLNSPVRP